MNKIFKVLVTLALFSTVLVGCGKDKTSSGEKVFNDYVTSQATTLDSNLATDSVSGQIVYNFSERLVSVDSEGNINPGVAEKWELSDSDKTLTFTLRKDAAWYDKDGKEYGKVTAQDFVSAFDFLKKKDAAGENITQNVVYITKYLDVVSYEAKSDTEFVIKLNKAEPYSVAMFSHYAMAPRPTKFIEELGGDDNYGLGADSVLSNGAFYLNSYDATKQASLIKNEKYWNAKKVDLEKVNVRIYNSPENNMLVNEYEAGNLSRIALLGENVTKYADSDDLVIQTEGAVFNFVMNFQPPAGSDMEYFAKNVNGRRALAQAYDPKYITGTILKAGLPSPYWVAAGLDTEDGKTFREDADKYEEGFIKYDVEAAKESWEKFKAETGKSEFTINILNYDSDSAKQIAEYVQQELEKNLVGLKVNITPLAFQDKLAKAKKGDFDVNFYGWSSDYPNAKGFLTNYETTSDYNEIKFDNAKYDELLAKGDRESLHEAEKILLLDEVAQMPGYQRTRAVLLDQKFTGFDLLPFGGDYDYKMIKVK